MKTVPKLTTNELVRDALLSAILFVSQVSLAWISNVELVSLLLILYTLVFRKHVWLILYVFIVLEGLVYGFGLWWFSYLYVWPILPAAVFLFIRVTPPKPLPISILSGIFGMLFGLLCALSYLIFAGPGAAFVWWTAGIPFDIIHGIGNFVLSLILFSPLYRLLTALKRN
jgi:energy-coupling factor transport system substrate-specific component